MNISKIKRYEPGDYSPYEHRDGQYCLYSEVETILKEKEAEIEQLKTYRDDNRIHADRLEIKLTAYSELMERMNTTIREVEVMMEQNNMNNDFDGIWRDSDEEILAATKKLQTDFKNLKG